jgi:hypothetical protein
MGKLIMLKKIRLVTHITRVMIFGMIAVGMPSLLFAEDDILNELRVCAAIDGDSSRLACYDKVGGYQEPAPLIVSERTAVPPDELGSESLGRKKDDKVEPTSFAARVTKCTKDALKKKYVFHLEGGQVWKQISDKRLYFKECDFNVTIRKDFFGYKMQQEGEKVRFRVSRVR